MASNAAIYFEHVPEAKILEKLSQPALDNLTSLTHDWSAASGLLVRTPETGDFEHLKDKTLWMGCAVTLMPSLTPRKCFTLASQLAPHFSKLFFRMANDETFIEECLSEIKDEFTVRLMDIYRRLKNQENKQTIKLGIYRSDYMIHVEYDTENRTFSTHLRQIEINSIAASFSHLAQLATRLHSSCSINHLLPTDHNFEYQQRYLLFKCPFAYPGLSYRNIVPNESHMAIPTALAEAHKQFLIQRPRVLDETHRAGILMITQPGERNRIDQRQIEYTLLQAFDVYLIRTTFQDVHKNAYLNENNDLILRQKCSGVEYDVLATVVYFRAGYAPTDYTSESDWEARFMIEQSAAIKTPDISYHLCGTKKVQQYLSEPGVIERFFPDEPETPKLLRTCFAGMYDIHRNGKYKDKIELAKQFPEKFVMKPQREGGGSLVFGDKIREALDTWDDDTLASYILMDRVYPIPTPNHLVMSGSVTPLLPVIPELGIFHSYLTNGDTILLDHVGGYLVRTKCDSTEDGGVAAGRAALDSIYLIDLPWDIQQEKEVTADKVNKELEALKSTECYQIWSQAPNDLTILTQLGIKCHSEGNYEVACGYFLKALQLDDADAEVWHYLGKCYIQLQNIRGAYDAFQQAITKNPAITEYWGSLGMLYLQINQIDDALRALQRAITLDAHQPSLWYAIGLVYESVNQFADAVQAYHRACELDPTSISLRDRYLLLVGRV